MGWSGMGKTPRTRDPWKAHRDGFGRFVSDNGSYRVVRVSLAPGVDASRRKHPIPSIGDRFGELSVTGYKVGVRGGLIAVVVQCSCATAEHMVDPHNLILGKSTRCNPCAKKASGYWTKKYHGYADVVPDEAHRRRLLGRIRACISRCHTPTSNAFIHYGARGIRVYAPWRIDNKAFLAYLVTLPGWDVPALELDREDVDKGYEPGNLRFVTHAKNMANKRSIADLEDLIRRLELENADLRSRLRGAEK